MFNEVTTGLLLVNLGSPEGPTPEALKPYLTEFLMDPEVIDIPLFLRWPLVHLFIVPTRSKTSAALYKKIWTNDGSPLLQNSRLFAAAIRNELTGQPNIQVELCMRYGSPSIREALENLTLERLDRLIVFPLYPQYAQSSTLTVEKKVLKELGAIGLKYPQPEWIKPFYKDPRYIESVKEVSEEAFVGFDPDFSLFSFHGLPVRHLKRLSANCLEVSECCAEINAENEYCYRAQCFSTARSVADALNIDSDRYAVSFQSRLGRTPWIQPYTDLLIQDLPRRGVKKLAVFCPSFVADCLETLDEIENRERDRFRSAGGRELRLMPSLNDNPVWVRSATQIVMDTLANS